MSSSGAGTNGVVDAATCIQYAPPPTSSDLLDATGAYLTSAEADAASFQVTDVNWTALSLVDSETAAAGVDGVALRKSKCKTEKSPQKSAASKTLKSGVAKPTPAKKTPKTKNKKVTF